MEHVISNLTSVWCLHCHINAVKGLLCVPRLVPKVFLFNITLFFHKDAACHQLWATCMEAIMHNQY